MSSEDQAGSTMRQALRIMSAPAKETSRTRAQSTVLSSGVFVLLATLLTASHLDSALEMSVSACAVAIPCLLWDILWSTWQPPEPKVPGWRIPMAFNITAWGIGGLGDLAFAGAILAVIWHLSQFAGKLFIITSVSVLILGLLVGFVGLIVWASHRMRVEAKTKATTEAAEGAKEEETVRDS